MSYVGPIGVLIVEDQDVVRIGLGLSLENYPEIALLGEVGDGVDAVTEAVAIRPDVILMDIGLPRLDGIAAATLIKKQLKTRIIMFTEHDDDQSVFAALSAGADGYCLKDVSAEQLVKAIKTVADGAVWLDERVAGRVLRSYSAASSTGGFTQAKPAQSIYQSPVAQQPAGQSNAQSNQSEPMEHTAGRDAKSDMSAMQMNVLSLMVEGLDAEVISTRLGLTAEQVNSCLAQVMDRLAKSERAQAALADLRREMFKDVPNLSKWCPTCQSNLAPSFEKCPFDGAPLDLTHEEHLVGKTFAERYEIIELVGRGAMGIVYKARHKFMNKIVAIKVLHPYLLSDVNNLKRFRHEAQAASALEHPNVIRIFDFGLTTSGEAFLVMELLQGASLDVVLREETCLPVARSMRIFLQCCDALEHAHAHGIVHKDLKPSNIVLSSERSGTESVRIVDFGIAKFMSSDGTAPSLTQSGVIVGSPNYMSPEQCQGFPVDTRCDIYSFACLMYETLSGRPPFQGSSTDVMYKHVHETPQSLRKLQPQLYIPETLDNIVLKSLAKQPNGRHQSIRELKEDLLSFCASSPSIH